MDKRILKLIGLMFLMLGSIFLSIILIGVLKIHWAFKIIIGIIGLALSIFAFILMQKINQKYVSMLKEDYKEEIKDRKELESAEAKVQTKNYTFGAILCPKCRKPYDGNVCFNCGYVNPKNKEEE